MIVAAYNRDEKIMPLLNNIMNNTEGLQVEVLVVDGSCNTKIARACEGCEFAKYIPNENDQGPGHARSVGAILAKGRYIAFVDTDDIWLNNKAFLQIKYMEANNYNFTYTSYEVYYPENEKTFLRIPIKLINFKIALISRGICLSTVMIKNTEDWQRVMQKYVSRGEDYFWWLSYFKTTKECAHLYDIVGTKYSVSYDSLSNQRLKHHLEIFKYYREFCGNFMMTCFCYMLYITFAGCFKLKSRWLAR